jgi:hypothetical protein
MIGESRLKKVDYSIMSNKNCTCGRPLKKNSELKGHKRCYVCFKLKSGKKTTTNNGKKRDFVKEYWANIRTYRPELLKNFPKMVTL